jgi:hypothetical protein
MGVVGEGDGMRKVTLTLLEVGDRVALLKDYSTLHPQMTRGAQGVVYACHGTGVGSQMSVVFDFDTESMPLTDRRNRHQEHGLDQ